MFHRGGLSELTVLHRKEKEARLVSARSLVNYKIIQNCLFNYMLYQKCK